MKTGTVIYEANRIAAVKAKMAARKSKASWINISNALALPMHIPHVNWPGRTSSNSMQQQSHNINFCHTCLKPHDDDHPNL
ncbi:unnamed protein product [Schistocephalus solidus]|uniref:Uncharacterized protein n=1 Tax=Schistocephalus solidus TaxID=70667 RepID=A0A183TMU7_SCHSO|nr:unnamed protein product [Schistocephalus solidus]